jgi:F0F1-type ATP synthase delta subunit
LNKAQVCQEVKQAKVVSAFALTEKERSEIKHRLKECLGREFNLEEEVCPQLVAGLVINLGSLVLDGSLRYEIQEAARDVRSRAEA